MYDFLKQLLGSFAWKTIVCSGTVCLFMNGEGWKFLNRENVKIKILTWNMPGEMFKSSVGQSFFFHVIIFVH